MQSVRGVQGIPCLGGHLDLTPVALPSGVEVAREIAIRVGAHELGLTSFAIVLALPFASFAIVLATFACIAFRAFTFRPHGESRPVVSLQCKCRNQ
jgi:hypothetical protein